MAEDTKNKKETKVEVPQAPAYDKEQFAQAPQFTVGQKAFIAGMNESTFPMTMAQMKNKLGVK